MNKTIQAKHLSDRVILEFLAGLNEWATWFRPDSGGMPSVASVLPADTPLKVILAKMASLIKRGLVDGCPCGCRGDYVITQHGRDWLG